MKKKILVIDDDTEFLEELHEMLALSGYDTVSVNDGSAAFKIAKEVRPDLILVDLKMDGLSGFQVADRLNQFVETVDIPVIAMSGHFTEKEHSRLLDMLGVKALIKKPFHPLNVIAYIERFTDEYYTDWKIPEAGKGGERYAENKDE